MKILFADFTFFKKVNSENVGRLKKALLLSVAN